jgi:glycosyltransferase involved in cell wall biosynthesis
VQEAGDYDARRQLERWRRFEQKAWKSVDRVVTMSEKDRRAVHGAPVTVIPNGVDLERFQPAGIEPESRRLLFIGAFAHLPNVMATEFLLREVLPRLLDAGVTLHVIAGARHEFYLRHYHAQVQLPPIPGNVELEGFVADVRPAYARAAVVLAPLVASAGTNIKILEAMAMGKAIVSTPAGVNGIEVRPGIDLLVTPSAVGMADAIRRLVEVPGERQRLEAAARRSAERAWSWDRISERQAALYRELIGQ